MTARPATRWLAMLIAALITIVPVCLVMLAILALAGYFFIVR